MQIPAKTKQRTKDRSQDEGRQGGAAPKRGRGRRAHNSVRRLN